MEDNMKRRQIPAFGNWDYCEELPITQYFESASQAGLLRGRGEGGGGGGGGIAAAAVPPAPLPHYYYFGHGAKEDLFKIPAPVVVTAYPRKVRKVSTLEKQKKHQQRQYVMADQVMQLQKQQQKQGRVCDCNLTTPHQHHQQQQPQRRPRAPKAVDEDLYKIPPELLHQKPRRKRMVGMRDFWSRCLGLNCIP